MCKRNVFNPNTKANEDVCMCFTCLLLLACLFVHKNRLVRKCQHKSYFTALVVVCERYIRIDSRWYYWREVKCNIVCVFIHSHSPCSCLLYTYRRVLTEKGHWKKVYVKKMPIEFYQTNEFIQWSTLKSWQIPFLFMCGFPFVGYQINY